MTGFDITSILDFNPPSYICPACRGLIPFYDTNYHVADSDPRKHTCRVCSVGLLFDNSDFWQPPTLYEYFKQSHHHIDQRDRLAHATTLAKLVRDSRATTHTPPWPTMRLLFEALSRARHFVHFASWGISHIMIGALKATSMRVPVYGFASNLHANTRAELVDFPTETPQFHPRAIDSGNGAVSAPHQKLIIVDGLLAFKGSTNLTQQGIRNADSGLDISEAVTNFAEVTDLNNRYFAPVWKSLTSPAETFVCDLAPF